MDKTNWPAWFYGPDGKSDVFEKAGDVPKGWEDHPSKVGKKAPAAEKPKPADDAATAKPAKAPTAEKPANPLAEARKAYRALTGKGVSPKWDVDAINAKIAEHKAAADTHDL